MIQLQSQGTAMEAVKKASMLSLIISLSALLLIAAATTPSTYDIFNLDRYNTQQLEAIKRASRVEGLPGQPPVAFHQYSGYIGVNETHGRALFYWFIEAPSHSKPLVLWLNGGPGCSSIGYGASQELGPFRVNKNGSGLTFNQYSWNQEANMLFLDSPVGVGFSYSNDSKDAFNYGDKLTAKEAYIFLINWFKIFPKFKSYDFYMTGESYAGHYIPQLASLVHDYNKEPLKYPTINLKGFMVGNPSTDDHYDWVGIIDYAWSHAIISDQLYESIVRTCDFTQAKWTPICLQEVNKVFVEYANIDIYNIYGSICTSNTSTLGQANPKALQSLILGNGRPLYPSGYDPCLEQHTIKYFNKPEVQQALHANISGTIPYAWSVCNEVLFQNWQDTDFSILPIYKKLIEAGLRIWVYSGDVDGRIPVSATRYTLNNLHLSIVSPWHAWYHKSQVGGWTQEFEGLTYVTVRGAGHLVPKDSPSKALTLFSSFLNNLTLPSNVSLWH